jgi:hypothetical protein
MVVYVLENHETGERIVSSLAERIDEYENDIWKFYMTSSRVFDLDDKDVFAKIVELYDAGDRLATQVLEYRYAMKGVE